MCKYHCTTNGYLKFLEKYKNTILPNMLLVMIIVLIIDIDTSCQQYSIIIYECLPGLDVNTFISTSNSHVIVHYYKLLTS